MTDDGSGGVIIVWWDNRNDVTTSSDIYAQRVDADGNIQWTSNGILVCNATEQQAYPKIVSDGNNGAIIVWVDYRDGSNSATIYGQRINSSGVAQWTSNGVQLSSTSNGKREPYICSDGAGGAIITWDEKATAGAYYDVRAQRVDVSGNVQWGTNGILVYDDSSSPSNQEFPHVAADGAGGCVIAWEDKRDGSAYYIYAQRLNSSGALQWGSSGILLSEATSSAEHNPVVICDASANSIITWADYNGTDYNIMAQRLNGSGTRLWGVNGLTVCDATGNQTDPHLISDGSNGAIVSWTDARGSNKDIYSQKINSNGTVARTANGVVICDATNDQLFDSYKYKEIATDNSGGAIITWADKRSATSSTQPDIYSQRINSSGIVQWTNNGIAVCTASRGQWTPMILPDGSSGAFVVWPDYRNGSYSDIYMQRINGSGTLTPVELTSFTAHVIVNSVTLNWQTATEVNNYGFEVQRASSSTTPRQGWKEIGFVQGHGNSNSPKEYSFTDDNPPSGTVQYRLKQIDVNGEFEYSDVVEVNVGVPKKFELSQNYPNPFNPTTTIKYSIPSLVNGHSSLVQLKVYDVLGREVKKLIDREQSPGNYSVQFNANNLPSGVYFFKLRSGDFTQTRKMVLIK
jgi:hypothetical protein